MFSVRTDRRLLPTDAATRKVRIQLRASRLGRLQERPPLCLGLVLDRSGSMSGGKLTLTLEAAALALRALQPGDRYSIVAYNDTVALVAPSSAASSEAIARSELALRAITAEGNTDLAAGWLSGCAQVGDAGASHDALGRCLLITDGLANRGITHVDELVRHAAELRQRNVTTSTLGVGDDFDEALLHRLADAGGGHFYYAADASQIPGLVAAEVGHALATVAREARLWLRASVDLRVESQNDDPCIRDGARYCVELGSLGSGELRTAVLALDFPQGAVGSTVSIGFALSDRDGALPRDELTLTWTRCIDGEWEREAPDLEVVRESATLEVAGARLRALTEHKLGNFSDAVQSLVSHVERLRAEAGDDPVLLSLARSLELDLARNTFSEPMLSPTGKVIRYDAYLSRKAGFLPGALTRPRVRTLFLRWLEPALAPIVDEARKALASDAAAAGVEAIAMPTKLTPPIGPRLDRAEELRIVRAIAQAPTLTVAFTNCGHHDNWFSHWHESERVALVSLHDWARISSISCSALAAYEAILHGLRVLSPLYDPAEFLHEETRGCLFDFCQQKEEVEIKLQAGHICQQCMEQLSNCRIDSHAVAHLWSAVVQLAHAPLLSQVQRGS
jgi:Ca-activated chloride channel family protein